VARARGESSDSINQQSGQRQTKRQKKMDQTKKKQALQARLDAYRQRASEKALISLLSESTVSSAAESIWLTLHIEAKEYSFALKSVPVKLTYTNNYASNKHASVQTERYQPSALVPMQDMQWKHGSSGTVEGHPAGGPPVRCTIVRSNKAKNADAPLRLVFEGTLRWQQQPTRLSLRAHGWCLHFHYSILDGGSLRLTRASPPRFVLHLPRAHVDGDAA